ncbi:DUF4112 domain-containing protein [Pseudooctadecabacter jejudonensis]|uniref:DUF4112 domain-containing protein n=1 Tax=Pseudooctadecabacter jejudonensis TaxID=1391910 RepID=A0A1Y5RII9_9RHOB|nr:DUF4112 domain-containing protein [Pseudooctadecabacter jejudonensis]SLN18361.1 hypothetical protein PSJ8397_00592 [Pseudooctadecabacter jejudonensis]
MTENDIDIEQLERLATRMDALFRVPGTTIDVGLDAVLGLVPVVGDALALAPSIYIYQQGHRAGVPSTTKGRMLANIGIDWLIGSIPLVGDIFDIGYKSKLRNVALIRQHLEATGRLPPNAAPALPKDPSPR